jgi:hypothetical protein
MFLLLALRNLTHKPWRSALLFLGYGLGVSVMIVLLSIGEALITQARDEKLVGGGSVTVLPEGLDVEVMKTGGLGGLFFSIPNARFVQQQLLASPRLAGQVTAVAPQIEGKLLYLRTADGRELPVRAGGEIPSASRAVGAPAPVASGRWEDDAADARWMHPTLAELRHDMDHFHRPPAGLANPASWGEWHYFNVLSPDRTRWTFISFIVAGDIASGDPLRWGGQVLVTTHREGGSARRYTATVPSSAVRWSTTDADLAIGANAVTVDAEGRYHVRARTRADDGGTMDVDLVVTPAPRAYFPGATLLSGDFASGYAVAGLRSDATGTLCERGDCTRYDGTQAYHDHNWGTWQGVTWEWGATRAGAYTILYGRVNPPDAAQPGADGGASSPLFVYVVDSLGFRALFRPREIRYEDGRTIQVDGRPLRVPSRAELFDARGADTLRLVLEVEDATATDTRKGLVERGEGDYARRLAKPFFVQMKGSARLSGRSGGSALSGDGAGFFETYR